LSKRIEHHRAELSEFIKEEHAGMQRMTSMFLEGRRSSQGRTRHVPSHRLNLWTISALKRFVNLVTFYHMPDLVPRAFPHVRNGAKKML
jgi:hypothetical protein